MASPRTSTRAELGTRAVGPLLFKLAAPAAVGILSIVLYNVVDTIFVGRWVGPLGIAAVGVIGPITFLIASTGMAIGVGGASIISRALGADDEERAWKTFGNLITLTAGLSTAAIALGFAFEAPIIRAFGAKGDIFPHASLYYRILLTGLPFLAFAMMANNVIRAEGQARVAMMTMVVPGVVNIVLDPIFIRVLGLGLAGAAWATVIAYASSAAYALWFYLAGRSELRFSPAFLRLEWPLVRETFTIGVTTWARQASQSALALAVNNMLFKFGGETAITSFTIISRIQMVAFIPLFGLVQGFMPIAGYNFGARIYARVRRTLGTSMGAGTVLSGLIFGIIVWAAHPVVSIFSTDAALVADTVRPLRIVMLATPILGVQLLGAAYFQAIGKALPALFLTLTRQVIFLIPLVVALPGWFGLDGIWVSFPIAEMAAMLTTAVFLVPQWCRLGRLQSARPGRVSPSVAGSPEPPTAPTGG